ncbi:MAG TPA: hypothetical protein VIJ75_06500 [Hanamia sp.]
MDKNLHNIEDLFRKGLEDNEEMPPENSWDRIDKILDKDKVISIHKKYVRLKWVSILLLFFLAGVGMYVWNTRKNNNPEKKGITILKKEIKSKNNKVDLSNWDNKTDVEKRVDSTNTIVVGNHQNPVKEIGHTKIDKNILNTEDKKSEMHPAPKKTIASSITKSLSSLPVSKESKMSEENTKPDIAKNLLNSPITKQEKKIENKLYNESNINIPAHHEGAMDVDKILLPLIQFHSLPVNEVKSSTTDLIETKKLLQATALSKPNLKIE